MRGLRGSDANGRCEWEPCRASASWPRHGYAIVTGEARATCTRIACWRGKGRSWRGSSPGLSDAPIEQGAIAGDVAKNVAIDSYGRRLAQGESGPLRAPKSP
jgi:hypothetical protein